MENTLCTYFEFLRTELLPLFSNRELAIIIWGVIFLGYALYNKGLGDSLMRLLRIFYGYKLVTIRLILYLQIGGLTYIMFRTGVFSHYSLIKTVVEYSLFSAVVLLYESISDPSEQIRRTVLNYLAATTILTVYLNSFSYSLIAELILLPTVCLLIAIITYAQYKADSQYKTAGGCATVILLLLALSGIAYVIYQSTHCQPEIIMEGLAREVFVPLVMTCFLIPYVYFVAVISKYESLFVRLDVRRKNEKNVSGNHYRKWKIAIIKKCGLNVAKIEFCTKQLKIFMYETDEDFFNALDKIGKEADQSSS